MDRRACLDDMEKRKSLALAGNRMPTPRSSSPTELAKINVPVPTEHRIPIVQIAANSLIKYPCPY
jgi:hypothetical protein